MENTLFCTKNAVGVTHLPLAFALHEAAAYLSEKNGQELGTLYLLQLSAGLALQHLLNSTGELGRAGSNLANLFSVAASCYPNARPFSTLVKSKPALHQKLVGTNVLAPPQGFHITAVDLYQLILSTAWLLELAENGVDRHKRRTA